MRKAFIIDLTAWTLLGIAIVAGAYACYVFSKEISKDLAENIVDAF